MEKKSIIDRLNEMVSQKINESMTEINSINASKANETKSSAGDKYETGMAMLQIEEQKANVQLAKAKELRKTLSMIGVSDSHDKIGLGSLVETSNGIYFISIGLGLLDIDDDKVFVLSISSPIGMQLKDKRAGDEIIFNSKTITILKVQ